MIDWVSVGFGATWILGLSLILAAVSLANHLAGRDQRRLWDILTQGGFPVAVNLGLALFCLGWLDGADAAWEKALWGLLALSFAVQGWLAQRERRGRDHGRRQP